VQPELRQLPKLPVQKPARYPVSRANITVFEKQPDALNKQQPANAPIQSQDERAVEKRETPLASNSIYAPKKGRGKKWNRNSGKTAETPSAPSSQDAEVTQREEDRTSIPTAV
jgi:hypothetical protein